MSILSQARNTEFWNGYTHGRHKMKIALRGFLAQGKEAGSAFSRNYVRVLLTWHCVKKTARRLHFMPTGSIEISCIFSSGHRYRNSCETIVVVSAVKKSHYTCSHPKKCEKSTFNQRLNRYVLNCQRLHGSHGQFKRFQSYRWT